MADIDCFSVPFHPVCRGAVAKRSNENFKKSNHTWKSIPLPFAYMIFHQVKRNDRKHSTGDVDKDEGALRLFSFILRKNNQDKRNLRENNFNKLWRRYFETK